MGASCPIRFGAGQGLYLPRDACSVRSGGAHNDPHISSACPVSLVVWGAAAQQLVPSRVHRNGSGLCAVVSAASPRLFMHDRAAEGCRREVCWLARCLQGCLRRTVATIVSKRAGSRLSMGRSPDWLKFKNPAASAVRREAEDWDRRRRQ